MRGAVLLFLLLAAGCSVGRTARGPAEGPRQRHVEVALDPSLLSSPEGSGAAWMRYAIHLASSTSMDGFARELAARRQLVEAWREISRDRRTTDAYLDGLVAIADAGFLVEYVVAGFARPSWTLDAKTVRTLRLREFLVFMGREQRGHRPVTLASVRGPDAPVDTAVADGLFTEADLQLRGRPCQDVLPSTLETLGRAETLLGGVPEMVMAPAGRREFIESLMDGEVLQDGAKRGVRWVSPSVGDGYFLAGFCAVELGAGPRAVELLARAVALRPQNARVRGEYAHALLMQRRFDDAMGALDAALASSADPCEQARFWRQRGYALVELGRLKDARAAYLHSLDYEPKNPTAIKEIGFISERLRQGGEVVAEVIAPAPEGGGRMQQFISVCTLP